MGALYMHLRAVCRPVCTPLVGDLNAARHSDSQLLVSGTGSLKMEYPLVYIYINFILLVNFGKSAAWAVRLSSESVVTSTSTQP
jgi:hypothetical protein